ncbi:MAG: protein kinase [Lentisphaerota bacterium]
MTKKLAKKDAAGKIQERRAAPLSGLAGTVDATTLRVEVVPDHSMEPAGPAVAPHFASSARVRVAETEKYLIDRLLARGGMGLVYEARDLMCQRPVAIKVLIHGLEGKEDAQRFHEEARIISQLEHPNIVPLHELGYDTEGRLFYSMKFVKGVTLADVINAIRNKDSDTLNRYPLGKLLTIFQKTCDAVAFAHSRGILHRDLKPGNIMIGDYGEVLVLDWGLARRLDAPRPPGSFRRPSSNPSGPVIEPGVSREGKEGIVIKFHTSQNRARTGQQSVLGTPGFMAPEQLEPEGSQVDERSDIYALGAILYSILALRPPLGGQDMPALLQSILRGDIVPPARVKAGEEHGALFSHCPDGQIPAVLSDAAMKALSMNPSDRYQSVKDLQRDVEDYQNGLIWHLLVDETFSDDEVLSRWEVVGGRYEIRPGEFHLHGGEPQMLLLRRELPGDVRIEFDCVLDDTYLNDVACILNAIRLPSATDTFFSGYQFKYGASNNSLDVLVRLGKNVWTWAESPLERGRHYHVAAERVGSRLTWVVNNVELMNYIDHNPLSGADRTLAGVTGWVTHTIFKRIRVFTLGTPWKSDIVDTAERQLLKGHYTTASDLFQDVLNSFPDSERKERARRGHQKSQELAAVMRRLPEWRRRLEEAWPRVAFQLRMDSEGLALEIPPASVSGLGPLSGIPLNSLNCKSNNITSLAPLAGMPLISLNCGENPVASLEPLKGMPLESLFCESCSVEHLNPLRGMPLTTLNCSENPLKSGLEPLKGLSLNWLSCLACGITKLDPLRGMPLNVLNCDANRIVSLEPLRGMPLTSLTCSGNRIESLDPLQGVPLNVLHCGANRIKSLEPLRGMMLGMMTCHCNLISDLEPLKNMPLGSLVCGENQLKSIGTFIRNPPVNFVFECETLADKELRRIRDIWRRDERFVEHARKVEVLLAVRQLDVEKLRSMAVNFDGRRYLYIPRLMRWAGARALCERLGGHLLTIGTREKNDFIASLFVTGSWFWIGLTTGPQGHEWITGEPVDFKLFGSLSHEKAIGPKVFCCKDWCFDVAPDPRNSFMVEWDG